jgi:hypothetical protein
VEHTWLDSHIPASHIDICYLLDVVYPLLRITDFIKSPFFEDVYFLKQSFFVSLFRTKKRDLLEKVPNLDNGNNRIDSLLINEVQLILAEKRTSLGVMRTGIAVLALPLSVMSVLIATSKYYNVVNVLHFIVPVGSLSVALTIFGSYLIIRSMARIRHYDRLIHAIKMKHSVIGEFID